MVTHVCRYTHLVIVTLCEYCRYWDIVAASCMAPEFCFLYSAHSMCAHTALQNLVGKSTVSIESSIKKAAQIY